MGVQVLTILLTRPNTLSNTQWHTRQNTYTHVKDASGRTVSRSLGDVNSSDKEAILIYRRTPALGCAAPALSESHTLLWAASQLRLPFMTVANLSPLLGTVGGQWPPKKMQLVHPIVCLLSYCLTQSAVCTVHPFNYSHTQNYKIKHLLWHPTNLGTCAPKKCASVQFPALERCPCCPIPSWGSQ